MEGKARETQYQIFYSQTGRGWEVVGELSSAGGQTGAIRQYTLGMTETDGFWAAVPSRSWQPGTIAPKVTTTNVFVPVATPKAAAPQPDPEPAAA